MNSFTKGISKDKWVKNLKSKSDAKLSNDKDFTVFHLIYPKLNYNPLKDESF